MSVAAVTAPPPLRERPAPGAACSCLASVAACCCRLAACASRAFTAAASATLAAVIWFGRVDWLAVSVSIAAWHFAERGVLAEEVAVDDALALGVVEDAAGDAVEAAEEAAVLPLAAAVTVT